MTLLLQVSWLLPPWPRYSSIMGESIKNQRWNNSEPSKQQWQQITNPYNSASQVFVELKFETPTAFFSVKVTKDIGHHIFAPQRHSFQGLICSTRELSPLFARNSNLKASFWYLFFRANSLESICPLVERKKSKSYHPIWRRNNYVILLTWTSEYFLLIWYVYSESSLIRSPKGHKNLAY